MHSILRTSQPRTRIGLKASHPAFINNKPIFAYNAANGLFDLQNRAMTSVGALSFADNAGGYASKSTGSGIRIGLDRNVSPPTKLFTVIATFVARDLAATPRIFCSSSTTNYSGIWCHVGSGGEIELSWGSNTGVTSLTRRTLLAPAGSIVVNQPYSLVMGFLSDTTGFCYLNGVAQSLTASGTAATYSTGSGNGMLHSRLYSGTYLYGDQEIGSLIILPNPINAGLAQQISVNPWQLFEDYHRPMFLDAAAATFSPAWAANSNVIIQSRLAA